VVSVPLGVILKTVPHPISGQRMVFPPSEVVPYKFPSVACTSPPTGIRPPVTSKLNSVVKVCAGEAIAVATQTTRMMKANFNTLNFFITAPFPVRRIVIGFFRRWIRRLVLPATHEEHQTADASRGSYHEIKLGLNCVIRTEM
jgi:hypothetical protein